MAAERVLESMAVRFLGDSTGYQMAVSTAIKSTQRLVDKVGTSMVAIGTSMTILTSRMASFGKEIANVGMKFELEMSRIEGLVGASKAQMEEYRKTVLEMAPAFGKSPQELASALYYITSAGYEGAEALEVLRQSAMASVAGLGQTQTVADAVTTAVTAYGKENLTAKKAVDVLTAAVRVGKAEATSFADAMGRVIPVAASMGIAFGEVAGAMAVMSKAGLDAFEAGTAVRAMLGTIQKPSEESGEVLRMVGLTMGDLRNIIKRPGGIVEVLRLLRGKFADAEEAMSSIIPNIRAITGAWNLLSQNAEDVDKAMKEVREATDDLNRAFEVTADTASFKMDAALSTINTQLTEMGQNLARTVVPVFQEVSKYVGMFIKWLNDLDPAVKGTITVMGYLAASAGPVLISLGLLFPLISSGITAIVTIAGAVKAFGVALVSTPWALAVAGAAALGYAAVSLANHWRGATKEVEKHKKAIADIRTQADKGLSMAGTRTFEMMEDISKTQDPIERQRKIAAAMKDTAAEMKKVAALRDLYEKAKLRDPTRLNALGEALEAIGMAPGVEGRRAMKAEEQFKFYEKLMEKIKDRAQSLQKAQKDLNREFRKMRELEKDQFGFPLMKMGQSLRDQIESIGRMPEEVELSRMIQKGLGQAKRTGLPEQTEDEKFTENARKTKEQIAEIGQVLDALNVSIGNFDVSPLKALDRAIDEISVTIDKARIAKKLAEIQEKRAATLTHEINEQSAALYDQIKVFNLDAVAAAEYAAAVKGATASEIKDIGRLVAELEGLKIMREFETPQEKFSGRQDELNKLFIMRKLSVDAYTKALLSARKALEGLFAPVEAMDPRSAEFIAMAMNQRYMMQQQVPLPKRQPYSPGTPGALPGSAYDLAQFMPWNMANPYWAGGNMVGAPGANPYALQLPPATPPGAAQAQQANPYALNLPPGRSTDAQEQTDVLKDIRAELQKRGIPSVEVLGVKLT